MDPITIAAMIAAIGPMIQGITGAVQMGQAKKIERENPRPEATINETIQKLVDYAYGKTLKGDVAGGDIIRGEIKGATASGIKAASEMGSGAEAYGLYGELIGREQNAFAQQGRDIMAQNERYSGAFMDTLSQKAQDEQRVWNWNKGQPYMMAAEKASQLRTTGPMNLFSGVKGMSGIAANSYAQANDLTSPLSYGNTSDSTPKYTQDQLEQILAEALKKV